MEELIARLTSSVGIDADTARKSVGAVLTFLEKEGPDAEVGTLIEKLPGARDAMNEAATAGGGGGLMGALGGLMGGGIMGLAGQLQGFGLGMGQIQTLAKELFAYGREVAGEDTMGAIAGGIPGLSQFV
ncbi:DUF2267 domain-containing protein [Methylocella sp. CPCC 101449]|jgi:predicted lipid-binding transport protein (Tim44 family)|uniref:DUF2267 domain-containing protein n=1 Tax=Methylocella sp. CPCC 101449 TaxID=2987531 RepID=UPI000967E17B|nr:DUF2267 domain-containing protein [Methylocella sp. CPCC 101449]MBN9082316.1 DUF2267 domain-containing protein [Hyphomicrobiales bacterium]MDT2024195.1 DUF2267 domain-containing protein [Methylocella sp. CPCC 101449]OJY05290.1 MAG: hypothetical protein BGP04_07715 [Rhizobiales bacterium 62-17]HEV2571295.1 DUF2267 domain-containing protein [Beijerinckiaceae bacterium]